MLNTLRRIVQQVNQAAELPDALQLLVAETKKAMVTDCCSVYLANYDLQCFELMATDGLDASAVGHVSLNFSEGLVGLVGQREEPINVADAQSHPRFKYFPDVKEELLSAFLGTPIIHQRKVMGVLVVQQRESRQFSANEEAFLVTLAAQLANVLAHAQVRGMLVPGSGIATTAVRSLRGVPGAPGVVVGRALVSAPSIELDAVQSLRSDDAAHEQLRFGVALTATRGDLEGLHERMGGELATEFRAILDMYGQLANDPAIARAVVEEITAGWSAETGVKRVFSRYVGQFEAMQDPYLRERAADVRDLGQRILAHLVEPGSTVSDPGGPIILVAREVTAAMLAEYPRERLAGLVSLRGSNNSHAAILARALGIPAVLGIQEFPLSGLSGTELIIDGYAGEIFVDPPEAIRAEYQRLVVEETELRNYFLVEADLPAVTPDGHAVAIHLNAGLSADTEVGQAQGAEGVGLYRTEIPFMMQDRFPSEQTQADIYQQVMASFAGKPVTMRTLDVGGDKALPYFPVREDNPFLGWRGLRLTLDHPEIFLVQVRAMLRASIGYDNLRIMFPMVTSIAEVDEAMRLSRQAINEVREELRHSERSLTKPKLGVMVEVPALIYQIPQLAGRIDFLSVGSNDLTQYLLAVDRNNARVASLYDAFHPAVLAALQQISSDAQRFSLPVSICGELAGEPGGALLLMAMGYRQLSMNSHNIARIKWVIRRTPLTKAQEMLREVMTLESPQQVRAVVNAHLEALGLGGMLRAGR
ncbi:MAG: phosphoenolpyruvate--protein phosphotransferase [Gammaproteobacteria bacterium]|nr:phosphoenolpyruvate--protein phosphotransferase [Gammaproteobacteria bacterium]